MDLSAQLTERENFYNLHRAHRTHQGKTAFEVFRNGSSVELVGNGDATNGLMEMPQALLGSGFLLMICRDNREKG